MSGTGRETAGPTVVRGTIVEDVGSRNMPEAGLCVSQLDEGPGKGHSLTQGDGTYTTLPWTGSCESFHHPIGKQATAGGR